MLKLLHHILIELECAMEDLNDISTNMGSKIERGLKVEGRIYIVIAHHGLTRIEPTIYKITML